jgi:hypothetical protein
MWCSTPCLGVEETVNGWTTTGNSSRICCKTAVAATLEGACEVPPPLEEVQA